MLCCLDGKLSGERRTTCSAPMRRPITFAGSLAPLRLPQCFKKRAVLFEQPFDRQLLRQS